jgi:hypothetical protein
MHSRALLAVLMGWLLLVAAIPAPANAQATPEQLDRLSLDALTAPPPPAPRRYSPAPRASHSSYRGHSYHGSSRSRYHGRSTYRSRSAHRSYAPAHGRRTVPSSASHKHR